MSWLAEVLVWYSVPKKQTIPNEDQSLVKWDRKSAVVADGASVSFDSITWANVLCENYMKDQVITKEWIDRSVKNYSLLHDRDTLSWMKQAAYDRGSFATIFGMTLVPELSEIVVQAFGDTNGYFLFDGELGTVFPILDQEDFNASPDLISTNANENMYLTDDMIKNKTSIISISEYDCVVAVIATDALASWLMESTEEKISYLAGLKSEKDFQEFVELHRENHSLKLDDTTLLIMRFKRVLSPTD